MRYLAIIIILAGLVCPALAQTNGENLAKWVQIKNELTIKINHLQSIKDYWLAHSDTVIINISINNWPFLQPIQIKWKSNAEFRSAVNDSITAFKAQRTAAKDSINAYNTTGDNK